MAISARLIAGTLSFVSLFAAPAVRAETAAWCEQQWEVVTADPGPALQPSYKEMLARWQEYRGKCAGTIAYEARLAILYAQIGDSAKAREVLKGVEGKKSDYGYLVELASLQTELSEILADSRSDKRAKLKQLTGKYGAFVKRHPDFPPGYFVLGGLQTTLEEHREAIQTLIAGLNHTEKDKRRAPNLWGVYRNLTISFAETGNYRTALGAADVAFELKKGLTSDAYFAMALAKADAGTGNFKAARDALNVIAVKVPQVKNDPKFIETVNFLAAKQEAARQAAPKVTR